MRKLMLFCLLTVGVLANAQVKEGFVKYKTTMSSEGNDMTAMLGSNTSMALYFKNDRSLTEMTTPLFTMRTLTDSKGTLTLMDGTSEKIFTRTPASANTPGPHKPGAEPVVTVTTEKKKIMGFDCVKAVVIHKDNKGNPVNTTIWFTDRIVCQAPMGFVNADVLKKIKGLPLEVTLVQGPIKSVMTASDLSLKPVPDAVFMLSTTGYSEKKTTPHGRN